MQRIWEKKPAWAQTKDPSFILTISKFLPENINDHVNLIMATFEFGFGSTWSLEMTLSMAILLSPSRFTLTSSLYSGSIESTQPVIAKLCSNNCFLFTQDCLIMLISLTSSSWPESLSLETINILEFSQNIKI